MTLGLYMVGENQPIIRIRRGRTTRGKRAHLVPDVGPAQPQPNALCGADLYHGQTWQWLDDGEDCKPCESQARYGLRSGTLVLADPAVVAEFRRQMLARLGDRQAAAAQKAETRIAVEINRPRGSIVGSAAIRRTVHRADCPVVSSLPDDVRIVYLPVSEVRRQHGADGGHNDFCPECKPGAVLNRDRRRPKTMDEAQALSTQLGSRARERAMRAGVRPVRDTGGGMAFSSASEAAGDAYYAAGCPSTAALALGELKMHGGEHYPDCPAEPEALLEGDASEPDFGRCTCYDLNEFEERSIRRKEDGMWQRYRQRHPLGRRRPLDPAPEWTL